MKKKLNSLLSAIMMNLLHIRNGKKAYAIYALALFVFCSVGLVMKNFNDKIAMMSDSVTSYQQMIDKQSEQMKSITRERERFKYKYKDKYIDKYKDKYKDKYTGSRGSWRRRRRRGR